MTEDVDDYFRWLERECRYLHPKVIENGHCAFLVPKAYTVAIGTCRIGDKISLGDCWCYPSYEEALVAFALWDGTGEPEGWIRHPHTGRRVARTEGEMDENGRVVPIGDMYVRG